MGFEYTERWPQILEYFDDRVRAGIALNQRDVDLEAFLRNVGGGELTFSYPTGLIVTSSLPASVKPGTTVTKAVGHLKTAGSTPTVVNIVYQSLPVATLTFNAGSTFAEAAFSVTTGERSTSLWRVEIQTAGTGAVGLVVHLTN